MKQCIKCGKDINDNFEMCYTCYKKSLSPLSPNCAVDISQSTAQLRVQIELSQRDRNLKALCLRIIGYAYLRKLNLDYDTTIDQVINKSDELFKRIKERGYL